MPLVRFPDWLTAENAAKLARKARTTDRLADVAVEASGFALRNLGVGILRGDSDDETALQLFVGANQLQDVIAGGLRQVEIKKDDVWPRLHGTRQLNDALAGRVDVR